MNRINSSAFLALALCGSLTACSAHHRIAQTGIPQPPATTDDAERVVDLLHQIASALPSYEDDGLARFEGTEIAAVQADLKRFDGQNAEAVFPEDYAQIEADWERLVGLDVTLQKEHLI